MHPYQLVLQPVLIPLLSNTALSVISVSDTDTKATFPHRAGGQVGGVVDGSTNPEPLTRRESSYYRKYRKWFIGLHLTISTYPSKMVAPPPACPAVSVPYLGFFFF